MTSKEFPENYQDEAIGDAIRNFIEDNHVDGKAWEIYEGWFRHAFDVSPKALEKIGMLYLTKVYGLEEADAKAFAKGEKTEEVGYKQAGKTKYIADSKGFWEGVHKADPKLVKTKDLAFLIENDENGVAGWIMIRAIDGVTQNLNTLPGKLVTNAVCYRLSIAA
jgi:hypothetical protein